MPRPPALTRSTAVTEDGVRSAGGAATTLQPTWVEDAPACERTLARGTRVGRYSVVRWVGAGAMGEVYAAEDPELSRPVALKLMRYRVRQRKPDWVGRARLRREAQALARLSHPNVVPVYDVGVFDDRCFVAMELVHGQTLRRWARARPRTWREVVRVMIDAGRGLAAAHLAGMVHRDFKPDNVLIDDEDRVRVMDFGLARGTDDDDDDDPCSLSLADGLVTTLTKTGAVMGTPGYMSPEQHAGHRVDARGDQYSFCVALFELLYGFRPFAGPTVGDLARQKWVGHVRRMGSGGTSNTERDVPRWLRKIVARGLAPHPEERWSSMSALLGALRRGTRPSRYLSWLAASGIGMAVAGLSAAFASPSSPCDGGTQRVAEVWDQQRKHELRDAFDSTGRRYAADTYSAVERWVDDYADAWEGLHANTCHSAYERHELTAREHDRRMACLDRGLQRLDALIDVLTVGDATVLDRSVSAAAALGHPSECRTQRLGVPPPRDPAIAAQHHAVRAQLARAEAHDQAGDYERGLRVATVGLNDALATNDPLLEAEARLRRGHLLQRVRNLTEAERELSQAVWLAEGQGDDRVAAEAATHLVWLVGDLLDRTQDGLAWARHARSLLARTGNEPIPRAQLLEAEANVLVEDAEHDEALSKLERAIALREAHQGARHPGLAMAYNNFGSALTSAGRPEEALAQQRRALSIQRVALGPDHPHVG
ncbi:MAG: serine/threonine-protein kinase, partial [Deltaproteobacteria bacterium]|nr:serine/threonine-protein kinase [Deltaproteobacteria bacterium]